MSELPPRLPGVFNMLRYLRDPYGSTLRAFARHGDPHTVRAFGSDIVSTGDPALIRDIFAADPDGYAAFGAALFAPVMGAGSLLIVDGARHRAQRKLLAPPFHGARMRAYGRIIQDVARAQMATWPRDRPFALAPSLQSISLRVILHAVLGVSGEAETARFEQLIIDGVHALKPSLLMFKWLQRGFGGLGPWANFQRHLRRMRDAIYAELATRRADATPREDILSMILAARYDDGAPMRDEEVFDTLMTLLVAGYESSAIALGWALWLLARHPRVLAELRAALAAVAPDDVDAIAALPYLDAVCNETLRLQPIAPSVVRQLTRPLTLGKWTLPPGVCVSASIIALHRRPEVYPEPDAFRPERFRERTFAPYEYAPFGGGHRRCIGAAFALYEMKIVLATMLTAPDISLRLVDERPPGEVPRNTFIGQRRPIRVTLA